MAWLAEKGFKICLGDFVYENQNNFSGSPKERADDIMRFYKNPKINAIIATRGGYGSQSLLPYLDYDVIKQNPKPIIGFSDITALQNAVYAKSGVISWAGIMLKYDFAEGKIHPQTEKSFENAINGIFSPIRAGNIANRGIAEGIIIGGNLCTFMSLAGTEYFPSLDGKVLFIEDVDEKTYNIERMLIQLEQQKDFSRLAAIVFGTFTDCPLNHPQDKDIESILQQFAEAHKQIPMIKHFPHGHVKARFCLPIGIKAKLSAIGDIPVLEPAD